MKNAARTTTSVHNDKSLLNTCDIRDKYSLTQRNKRNAHEQISKTPFPNDEYENFINAHLEVAAEWIPTNPKAKSRVTLIGDISR